MVDVLVFAYDRQSLNLAEAESWVFFFGGGGVMINLKDKP